jgi:hypothetical protein
MTKNLFKISGFLALLTLLTFLGLYHALINCPDANYLAINGDFQNFNPLRRLHAGQVFFKDFDVYTGMGPNFANFILSLFFPLNLYNSKVIVYIVIFWHYVLLFFTFFRIIGMTSLWALASTCIFLLEAIDRRFFFLPRAFYSYFDKLFYPGISNVPLRFGIEIWTIFFLFITLRRDLPKNIKKLALGIILGSTIPWSNDFGFATYAATAILIFIVYLKEAFQISFKRKFLSSLIEASLNSLQVGLFSIFWCLLLIALLTQGHVIHFIKYCAGVAQDQYWYFLPNDKVLFLKELSSDIWILILSILVGLFYSFYKNKRLDHLLIAQIILTTNLGGIIKTLGSNIVDIYNFQIRNCIGILIIFYFVVTSCIPKKVFTYGSRIVPFFLGYCVLFHMYPMYIDYSFQTLANIKKEPLYVPELGGHVPKDLFEEFEFVKTLPSLTDSKESLLFSTYAGAPETLLNTISPSRVDYIIHALGKTAREDYIQSLTDLNTPFVSTINPNYTIWEDWLRKVNWNFYQVLIEKYQPFKRTAHRIFWEKRTQPLNKKEIVCNFAENSPWRWDLVIHFPGKPEKDSKPWIIDVNFDYEVETQKAIFHGLVRHHLSLYRDLSEKHLYNYYSDTVGVPLYEKHWQFESELSPGESKAHILMLVPEVYGKFKVSQCKATALMSKETLDGPPSSEPPKF